MRKLTTILLAALVYAGAADADAAGDSARGGGGRKASLQQQELYRGSRIIGAPVHDANDRKIGEVKDLLLDSGRGEVAYAVLGFNSRRRLHPVPWRALEPAADGGHYVLHADREVIAQAPGFDMGEWPDTDDQRWNEEIDRYWNRAVGRGPFPTQPLTSGNAGGSASSGAGNTGSGNAGRGERR
ncbi:MAG TPA: PRC-barrel domain-containing protein [Noviherbaspirillum sp.]|uniref:PRC-barrel domain-containing protein n=1 Tax=Noviherbaspirillum sp. TaxID=1926288 RepID=UPI002F95655A